MISLNVVPRSAIASLSEKAATNSTTRDICRKPEEDLSGQTVDDVAKIDKDVSKALVVHVG